MKFQLFLFVITIISLISCQKDSTEDNIPYSFYVGTYTNGDSQGIYRYSIQVDGYLRLIGLAARSDNPF